MASQIMRAGSEIKGPGTYINNAPRRKVGSVEGSCSGRPWNCA